MGVQKVRHRETGEVREAMLFSAESAVEVKAWADSFLPDQRSFLAVVGGHPVLALWLDDDPSSPPLQLMPDYWLLRRPDWDAPWHVGFQTMHGSEMSDFYNWEPAPTRVYYVVERFRAQEWRPVMAYETEQFAQMIAAECDGTVRVREVVVSKVVE